MDYTSCNFSSKMDFVLHFFICSYRLKKITFSRLHLITLNKTLSPVGLGCTAVIASSQLEVFFLSEIQKIQRMLISQKKNCSISAKLQQRNFCVPLLSKNIDLNWQKKKGRKKEMVLFWLWLVENNGAMSSPNQNWTPKQVCFTRFAALSAGCVH